ncbi:hypothetical protein As57867_005926, partial [Aphanomyces stellatus]
MTLSPHFQIRSVSTMLAISTLLLASVAAAQNYCSVETATAVSQALQSCGRSVGYNAFPQLQLLSATPFIRQGICGGTYAPECDALLQLGSNSDYDCDYDVYKGQHFNAANDVPSFCDPNGPSTSTVLLSVPVEFGAKALGVTEDSDVIVQFLSANTFPTFDFDFGNRDFQSNVNGECLFVNDEHSLKTMPCDPTNDWTKWTVFAGN